MTNPNTAHHTSVLTHPDWPTVAPYIRVEYYNRDGSARDPRFRLEVLTMPEDVAEVALKLEIGCPSCGRTIHPIRARALSKRSRAPHKRHYYLAVACPLDVSVACSRGYAARDEYLKIRAAL